jgi:hypothetical protein
VAAGPLELIANSGSPANGPGNGSGVHLGVEQVRDFLEGLVGFLGQHFELSAVVVAVWS